MTITKNIKKKKMKNNLVFVDFAELVYSVIGVTSSKRDVVEHIEQ